MDLKRPVMPVSSANAYKLPRSHSGLGSGSGLCGNHITKWTWNIPLEYAVPLSGDMRYLYPLWVSGKEETEKKLHQSDPPLSKTTGIQLGADGISPHNQNISNKIRNALRLLAFREIHVLVQFWSPLVVGKHQVLKTIDQPFGLGVLDEVLYLYKKDSERYSLVVDNNQENQICLSPPGRVFLRRSPEWTFDITSYLPKQFPQQDLATCCKFQGYLALPVFDSTTGLCVGVIEVLSGSSIYKSFAYEVQQIHKALKTQNLTCPQAFDNHATNSITQFPNERRDNELDKIFGILKSMCVTFDLPLAQTWGVSPSTNVVSHEKVLRKCCSSFNTKCIGKICISTAGLPFHVRDLRKWKFREESVKQHLDKSEGIVGRALASRGSYFCADVTLLNKEEFPLVHYARKDNLNSCVAIYVQSDEGDAKYILEFFLPSGMVNGRFVQEVVEALKLKFDVDSGFVLNDTLLRDWSDSESTVTNVSDQGSSNNVSMRKRCVATCTDDEVTSSPPKKLKIDFGLIQSVPIEVIFGQSTINFCLPIPLKLVDLEMEVAQRLNLEGKRPRLKYKDEVDDLILICTDADVSSAIKASGSCGTVSLNCATDLTLNGSYP